MPTEPEIAAHAAAIVEILRRHDRILVAAHGAPDGDAVGCTIAMGWILKAMGKEAVLLNASGLPAHFSWMSSPGRIYRRMYELPFWPELVVALDCGDAWRLGKELLEALPRIPSVNIDHHLGNPAYGSLYNWIEPGMAAVGQMVAALADAAGIPITGPLAESIYVSLVSDTGSFTYGNTTPAVFTLAARLLAGGLDAGSVRDRMDNQWSMAKTRLWGTLLRSISLEHEGRVALCRVTLDELGEAGAVKEDIEGFAEQMRKIQGVRIAVLLREDKPSGSKLSLRSCGEDDVREVAAQFGGGGHKNAAGARLDMTLDKAVPAVLAALKL